MYRLNKGHVRICLGDPKQLVVLRHPVSPTKRACLDLTATQTNRQVSDSRVLGLATPMAHHCIKTIRFSQLDGINRLAERADLIRLHQNRIAGLEVNCFLEALSVSHQ